MARLHREAKALVLLVVLALCAVGCSSLRGERQESGISTSAGSEELAFSDDESNIESKRTGNEAALFDFTAPDLFSGNAISGEELYENAPTIMIFVVPSCSVCVTEGPKLAAAAELNPDINYVLIHSFGTTEEYLSYIETAGIFQENIVHIADTDGLLWDQFSVTAQPSSILIDTAGDVTSSTGALGDDGLVRAAEVVR